MLLTQPNNLSGKIIKHKANLDVAWYVVKHIQENDQMRLEVFPINMGFTNSWIIDDSPIPFCVSQKEYDLWDLMIPKTPGDELKIISSVSHSPSIRHNDWIPILST